MQAILENILVMILTIVVPLTGFYLVLVLIEWMLKSKSGEREQKGLSDLLISSQADAYRCKKNNSVSDVDHPVDTD